jgi:hypothetical protein
MAIDDDSTSRPAPPDRAKCPSAWPEVSPDKIVVPDFASDLAYMGLYLKLEIVNRSPYLVREAELRIDGRGPGSPRTVTSREVKVGPLFPGVWFHEEVGIGAQGGVTGLRFNSVSAQAVKLTPPSEMMPSAHYPDLAAEILEVVDDQELPDLRENADDVSKEPRTASGTVIRIGVRNGGSAVVERVRLCLRYFETAGEAAQPKTAPSWGPVAEWIFDMPRRDWNPYGLRHVADAACEPADPLPPGQTYEFTVVHYEGGPRDWARRLDATSVEVLELKLRAEHRERD